MESLFEVSSTPADVDAAEVDFWGDEDGTEPHKDSLDLNREWEARRQQFHNLGYRDGITAGNNSAVQEGFNIGFKEAIVPAFGWGVARGASSAFSALPSTLKEMLLKDQHARKRLESLHSAISSISSAEAMGMYYRDLVSQNIGPSGKSVQGNALVDAQSKSSVQIQHEEGNLADPDEPQESIDGCCGRDSCGESSTCNSYGEDLVSSIIGEDESAAFVPKLTSGSSAQKPISKEAYKFVSSMSTSAGGRKHLEDSTTSHLGSLALGDTGASASSSTALELCNSLEEYQRKVKAELEPCVCKLSSFSKS